MGFVDNLQLLGGSLFEGEANSKIYGIALSINVLLDVKTL